MRIFLKVWVVIVIASIAAISEAFNLLNIWPHAPWSLIFYIAFLWFAVLITIQLLARDRRIKQLENAKPSIIVVTEVHSGHCCLRVQNVGERAEFSAHVEVINGQGSLLSLPTEYSACWEDTKTDNANLKKGEAARLDIATLETTPYAFGLMNWRLYYYAFTEQDAIGYIGGIKAAQSTSWVAGKKDTPTPDIMLRISITSDPSMKDGFDKTYQLTVDGLVETTS